MKSIIIVFIAVFFTGCTTGKGSSSKTPPADSPRPPPGYEKVKGTDAQLRTKKLGPSLAVVKARELNQRGWCLISFTVDSEGNTKDITIDDSSPKGVFDEACIASKEAVVYFPPTRNGESVDSVRSYELSVIRP